MDEIFYKLTDRRYIENNNTNPGNHTNDIIQYVKNNAKKIEEDYNRFASGITSATIYSNSMPGDAFCKFFLSTLLLSEGCYKDYEVPMNMVSYHPEYSFININKPRFINKKSSPSPQLTIDNYEKQQCHDQNWYRPLTRDISVYKKRVMPDLPVNSREWVYPIYQWK